MTTDRLTFPIALVVCLVTVGVSEWLREPPPVRSAADLSGFSAERAYDLLADLLSERMPHPVGSAENRRVRERIESFLTAEGIDYAVQRTWGCRSKYDNRCAWVENVIAWIPGKRDAPYVAMMAHYDSVPMSPGAGDDGAGVATILETARMLKAEGTHRNPLLLIITDAEEMGLLGAEAFFSQHPLAQQIGIVLNVEGAGTTGVSQVLRTFGGNREFISMYRDAAPHRVANSLTAEVFKRMPNDTDFSVATRADVPGVDFAFAGEFNHYHTPNDNLLNLDKRTLQHHGDNMLPLVRALIDTDLDAVEAGADLVYFVPLGLWIDWPVWMNWFFVAVGLACLCGIAWRTTLLKARRRMLALALLGPVLVLIGSMVSGLIAFKVIDLLAGTIVSWPSELVPYRVVLFAAPLFGGLATVIWLNGKLTVAQALAGGWLTWLLLGGLVSWAMPGATHVLLGPIVPGLLLVFTATLVESASARNCLLALSLVIAATQTLAVIPALEDSQGYRLAAVNFPLVALLVIVAGPLARGRGASVFLAMLGLVTVAGIFWAGNAPLYSDWRPQQINISYVENVDSADAYLVLDSLNPAPERMLRAGGMDQDDVAIFPWTDWTKDEVAIVAPGGGAPPTLRVISDVMDGEVRVLEIVIRSQRDPLALQLMVPVSADAEAIIVEGTEIEPVPVEFERFRDLYVLLLFGMGNEPVNVQLRLKNPEAFDAWIADSTTGLPPVAHEVLAARPPLASPAHWGDSALLIRRVSF